MKRVGWFLRVIIALCSLQSIHAQVGTIESIDQFKQETRHGMVAVLWYSKDAAHARDKEWNKAHERVQKAYEKVDSQTHYVRFFTVDLAKPALASLQQEQGLATLPYLAAVSLYKEGNKQAVLENITAKSWRAIRDELNTFVRDNFGASIRELEKRHKRERELAEEEEEDDDTSGPNISVGFYTGYPVGYYVDPFYYTPYYNYYPYNYWGSRPYYYYRSRGGRRDMHYSSGGSRSSCPSTGRTRHFMSSPRGSGSATRSFGGHRGGRGRR